MTAAGELRLTLCGVQDTYESDSVVSRTFKCMSLIVVPKTPSVQALFSGVKDIHEFDSGVIAWIKGIVQQKLRSVESGVNQ